jgi:hypothetical protein
MPGLKIASALLALILLSHSVAFAQNPPDFSGAWKSDPSRSDSSHQTVAAGPITLAIAQTQAQISMETKTEPQDKTSIANEKLIYKLDGSETTSTGASGEPVVCKARWQGSDLIADAVRSLNESTITTRWVLQLENGGKELRIKKTLTVQHGYQSQDPKNVGSGVDVFVKTSGSQSPSKP